MRLLPAVFANLYLLSAALGFGSLFQGMLPRALSKIDRITLTLLLGLGSVGTLIFLVGQIRLSRAVVFALLLLPGMLGLFLFWRWLYDFAPSLRVSHAPFIPCAVIAIVMLVTIVGGLAEPVGDIKMDAIAYHFLGPHVWLRDAIIHPLPDECLTSFPALVETLFVSLMALDGSRAPELFASFALALTLGSAYAFGQRLGLSSSQAWWAAALVSTMPVVYRGAYGGFNDAVLFCFVLASLRLGVDAQSSKGYVLAGLFAGLAMASKYTGMIAFLLIAGCILITSLVQRRTPLFEALRFNALFAAVAACVASPCYLRNWLVLGSPIYPPTPALLHFFSIKFMSPQAISLLAALVHKEGNGMGRDFWSFLLLPFHFTFHPANFLNGPGGVGVALLALAPLGLLLRGCDPFARIVMLFAFLQTVVWFVTEQEARFLIHVYIILAAFAVWGWSYVSSRTSRIGSFLADSAVALSILYGLLMIVPARADDIHAAVSSSYEQQRKEQLVRFLDSFGRLNSDPFVKKVLILEPRVPTYYLDKNYLKPVGRFGEETLPQGGDLSKILKDLGVLGITHVLDVRTAEHDFRLSNKPPDLVLIFDEADQRIYRYAPITEGR